MHSGAYERKLSRVLEVASAEPCTRVPAFAWENGPNLDAHAARLGLAPEAERAPCRVPIVSRHDANVSAQRASLLAEGLDPHRVEVALRLRHRPVDPDEALPLARRHVGVRLCARDCRRVRVGEKGKPSRRRTSCRSRGFNRVTKQVEFHVKPPALDALFMFLCTWTIV
eukprot:4374521-Pleurochrysis_carterae.AAC.2